MWVLLSAGLRRFVLVSIALPLAGGIAARLARSVEDHHGAGKLSKSLRAVSRGAGTLRGRQQHRGRRSGRGGQR